MTEGNRPFDAASTASQAEQTRRALIEAATFVFAEHGYEAGSIREITSRAPANQGAVTYHFGGKEGLYREVLAASVEALDADALLSPDDIDRLDLEPALNLFFRQFLSPLTRQDHVGRYFRIVAWESVRPTPVFNEFLATTPFSIFRLAEALVRRCRPEAMPAEVALATLWLVHQPFSFVRDAERLAGPPFRLAFDGAGFERLVSTLTSLCLNGLRAGQAT